MKFFRWLPVLAALSVFPALAQTTPVTTTLQSNAVANAPGSVLNTLGQGTAVYTVNCASCSGGTTVNFEGTQDSVNYGPLLATESGSTTTATSTTTAGVGLWQVTVAGLVNIRARVSGYSAGTGTVTATAVSTGGGGSGGSGGGGGSNASVGATGSSVPGSGTYAAGNKSGTLSGFVLDNSGYLYVDVGAGTITATNPSVGTIAATAPTSATYVGILSAGNLVGWNGSVGITGTLPAFAATPTVNLGTIGTAATAANQEVTVAGTSAASAQGVQGVTGGVALPISATALPLPTGAATSANQSTEISSLATIATNTGAAIPAGTALIGKVGIDQTTPGTTNAVQIAGQTATNHDCGGSITTGGTAQQIITTSQNVHGFLLQVGVNDSNTDPIYFSDTTTTPGAGVAGSLSLNPSTSTAAGGSFSTPLNYPTGTAIYANGATTGDKFKCRYW